MIRRTFAFAVLALAPCLEPFDIASAAHAQQSAKIPRLGHISPGDIPLRQWLSPSFAG